MNPGIGMYDLMLAAALLGAVWMALFGRDPFAATVFFIAYGLLLSLVWVQLSAPDVALAEASVGAGLTGALLLAAIRRFEPDPVLHEAPRLDGLNFLFGLLSLILIGANGAILWTLRDEKGGIQTLVEENMANSGSSHPVTSVLLNFRAFDTWLELGVLLLAALSAWIVDRINHEQVPSPPPMAIKEQYNVIATTMLPLLLVIGGIMLWFGTRSPGGAFQAGALMGAAGIFLQLADRRMFPSHSLMALRMTLALGFTAFILAALTTLAAGGRMLEYPLTAAGAFIIALEMAATLAIALAMNVLYAITARGEVLLR